MFQIMFSSKILFVVVLVAKMSYSSGWVLNNVDLQRLRDLREKSLLAETNQLDTDDLDSDMNETYLSMDEMFLNMIEMEMEMDDLSELRLSLIYPGTKWCGAGNNAENYDDLGSARETDMCCRAHDLCPDIIESGETKHGLTNSAFYTRLNCSCDDEFRECLHAANTRIANQIGTVYFNALSTKCYREDYPVVGCNKRGGWLFRKCLEPKYDIAGERQYQWFDVRKY